MTVTEIPVRFKSSELSRNAPVVFDAAERGPVEVTRRDGENLVLMSRREAQEREVLLNLAAQLIEVASDSNGSLAKRMADANPWMLALSEADQERCAKDLLRAARASFATGQAHLVTLELTSWRETAIGIAAGLGREPIEWLEDEPIVERP